MSNYKEETSTHRLDIVFWLLVIGIILGGVYANTLYAVLNVLVRTAIGVVLAIVAIGIALQTQHGKACWGLIKEARVEVRKVIWPTREETTQTTLIVVMVVIVVGLFLWALDSSLSWGIKLLIS